MKYSEILKLYLQVLSGDKTDLDFDVLKGINLKDIAKDVRENLLVFANRTLGEDFYRSLIDASLNNNKYIVSESDMEAFVAGKDAALLNFSKVYLDMFVNDKNIADQIDDKFDINPGLYNNDKFTFNLKFYDKIVEAKNTLDVKNKSFVDDTLSKANVDAFTDPVSEHMQKAYDTIFGVTQKNKIGDSLTRDNVEPAIKLLNKLETLHYSRNIFSRFFFFLGKVGDEYRLAKKIREDLTNKGVDIEKYDRAVRDNTLDNFIQNEKSKIYQPGLEEIDDKLSKQYYGNNGEEDIIDEYQRHDKEVNKELGKDSIFNQVKHEFKNYGEDISGRQEEIIDNKKYIRKEIKTQDKSQITDKEREIVKKYAKKYDGVHYYYNKNTAEYELFDKKGKGMFYTDNYERGFQEFKKVEAMAGMYDKDKQDRPMIEKQYTDEESELFEISKNFSEGLEDIEPIEKSEDVNNYMDVNFLDDANVVNEDNNEIVETQNDLANKLSETFKDLDKSGNISHKVEDKAIENEIVKEP